MQPLYIGWENRCAWDRELRAQSSERGSWVSALIAAADDPDKFHITTELASGSKGFGEKNTSSSNDHMDSSSLLAVQKEFPTSQCKCCISQERRERTSQWLSCLIF